MNKTFKSIFALAFMAVAMVFASCSKDDDNDPVVPTQQEIESKIVGKWKSTMTDGKIAITNNREVYTFTQNGIGTHSMSIFKPNENRWIWTNKVHTVYTVTSNKLSVRTNDGMPSIEDEVTFNIYVNEIDENQMSWNLNSVILHGVDIKDVSKIVFKKVTADYSNDIIGLWEGVEMTGYETYGNIEARIEYKADGTYTYYKKVDGEWQPLADVIDEWNVDGDWLATRWQNAGSDVINYEWWDIDYIKDGMMRWSALREKENGERFNTTFTWKKVR